MPGYLEFDVGIATLTKYDADKFPEVQIDAYGEKQSGVIPYELHSPHGLLTRCHDPSTDDDGDHVHGCQVLYALEGGKGHAWFLQDTRIVPLLPPLKKGGLCAYGGKLTTPSFINIDGDTGSHIHYVPYAIVGGVPTKAMSIQINVDNEGREAISIIHGSGASIAIVDSFGSVSTTIKNASGNSYIEVNDDGIILNGNVTAYGGMTSGALGALPVAKAPGVIAALTAIVTALTTLATFVDKTTPSTILIDTPLINPVFSAQLAIIVASMLPITATNTAAV